MRKRNLPVRVGQVWTWDGTSRTVTEVDAEDNLVRWDDGHSSMLDKCCETLRKWANGDDCGTLQTVVPFCVVGQRYLHGEKLFVIDTIDRELKILTFKDHIGEDYFLTEFETRNTSPHWKYLGEPEDESPKELTSIGAEMEKEFEYVVQPDGTLPLKNGGYLKQDQKWKRVCAGHILSEFTLGPIVIRDAYGEKCVWDTKNMSRSFKLFESGEYQLKDPPAGDQKEFRYKVDICNGEWFVSLKCGGTLSRGQRWRNQRDEEFTVEVANILEAGRSGYVTDTTGQNRPFRKFEEGDYIYLGGGSLWIYKQEEKKMKVDTRLTYKNVEIARMSMRTITNVAQSLAQMFGFYAEIDEAEQKVYFCKGQDLSESNEQEVTPDMIQQLFKEAIEKGENHSAIDFAIKHKILRGGNFEVV